MSTHTRPSKHPSTVPKPPLQVHPTTLLSPLTTLIGTHPIILAADCIIQPRATLDATFGGIECEEGVVVGGGCHIGTRDGLLGGNDGEGGRVGKGEGKGGRGRGMNIGKGTMIEEGAVVEGDVGVGCEIGVRGRIGGGSLVGDYCKIGPTCSVAEGEVLPDYTVLYGCNERRSEKRGMEGMRARTHEKHLETLGRLMNVSGGK